MPEDINEHPAQEPTPPTEDSPKPERRWSDKDILAAKDSKEVLEAYHGARKDRYATLYHLQSTVGERLTQLGDVENGMKFTLLGEQTRNAEMGNHQVEAWHEVAGRIEQASYKFLEAADKSENVGRGMNSAAESLQYTSQSIAHSADTMRSSAGVMDGVGREMQESSGRIGRAAEGINEASHRMESAARGSRGY